MFKAFSFCTLYLLSSLVYGQDDDFNPGSEIEINESKEKISKDPFTEEDPLSVESNPENTEALEELGDLPIEESTETADPTQIEAEEPAAIQAGDEPVLVRERVNPETHIAGNGSEDNLVEIRYAQAVFLPYKERQNTWGFLFSLGGEFLYFPNLISQFDDATYEDMFGNESQMATSLELGPKYNFTWGALGLTIGYAGLNITDDRLGGVEASLKFNRYSTTATLYLDALWSEAYLVPYVAVGAWQADYEETSNEYPGEKETYTTEIGYHWRTGAMIGLGWLEPDTALRSRRSVGLQEAFLNLYVTSSYMTESEPDPDLGSEMDIGATLVLEF